MKEESRRLTWDTSANGYVESPYRLQRERFLRGPIPLSWLIRAAGLPRAAFLVGSIVWYLRGLSRSRPAKLRPSVLREFGVQPKTAERALTALESAGLITVERHRGRSPVVTVVTVVTLHQGGL